MDKQTILKTTAFGGFEKKAVLDYIYKLNEEAEEVQAHLQEQLDEAKKANAAFDEKVKALTERADNAERELESAKNEAAGERARARELTMLNEHLDEEIDHQKEIISAKQREIDKYIRTYAELSGKNSALESARDEVEKSSAQLGKLMLDARRDAQAMVAKATEEADSIKARIKSEAESHTAKLQAEAEKLLNNAKAEADNRIAKAKEAQASALESAKQQSDAMVNEAKTSLDAVSSHFEAFRHDMSSIQSSILEAVSAMQQKSGFINSVMEAAQKKLEAAYTPVVHLETEDVAAGHLADTAAQPDTDTFIIHLETGDTASGQLIEDQADETQENAEIQQESEPEPTGNNFFR